MLPDVYEVWVWKGGDLPQGLVSEKRALSRPGRGQLLIHNEAIGLNPVDWKLLEIKENDVPGVDGAGVVVAVGEGVPEAWLGQRVAWHQSLKRSGSFAQYTEISADVVMRVPVALDMATAAAFPCPGLTAWQALEKIPHRQGQRLLISGAGGSVGQYLIQLAVARGFEVHTISHFRHHARLASLGATQCFTDPVTPDAWLPTVRYHAIIDTVDASRAVWLVKALRANGHFVAVQWRVEHWPCPPFEQAFSLHEVALGALHWQGDVEDWRTLMHDGEQLLEALATEQLQAEPLIIFGFDELAQYLLKLKRRDFSGKLVALNAR